MTKECCISSPHQELSYTPAVWEYLWQQNTVITPERLAEVFPAYRAFQQDPEHPLIWNTPFHTLSGQSAVIGLHGPTGAGKDTLLAGVEDAAVKIVTTTSRLPRPNESEGNPYHFISENLFNQYIQTNKFIEYVRQVSGFYGTTAQEVKEKIHQATNQHKPLIWKGNIEGHPTFTKEVLQRFGINTTSIFILPRLPIQEYYRHIENKRGREEAKKRWNTARMEIEHAPKYVDYILVNPFDLPDGKQQALDACMYLCSKLQSKK